MDLSQPNSAMRGMQCVGAILTTEFGWCRSWALHALLAGCHQRICCSPYTGEFWRCRGNPLCTGHAYLHTYSELTLGVCKQINLYPESCVMATGVGCGTGHANILYRSADYKWQNLLYSFSQMFLQSREFMLQKHTFLKHGVDGLPPGVSLDSRSEKTSQLKYAGDFLRLGRIDDDESITASFIFQSNSLEVTDTHRYFMTVPGVITTMGGTITAMLYVVLAPLAVYCLWKKCRGESVLELKIKVPQL